MLVCVIIIQIQIKYNNLYQKSYVRKSKGYSIKVISGILFGVLLAGYDKLLLPTSGVVDYLLGNKWIFTSLLSRII